MMNKYFFILLMAVIIAACSQIFLKKSSMKSHKSILKEYLNFQVIIGYSLMILSTILVIFAYRGLPYKNGPIIESLGYIFIMILSHYFLKEKMTKRKIIGNIVIVSGIIIFYI